LSQNFLKAANRLADLASNVATKGTCMRVLLIEDDRATAQSIELMLRSASFNVYTTDLGEEGIDLGKLYDYDIILLDLNLPDMSGFEVLRSLRVSKVKTPTLILSGIAGIEDKVKGFGFGADDYMTKPFHKDELVARIHAIVRRSRHDFGFNHGDAIIEVFRSTVRRGRIGACHGRHILRSSAVSKDRRWRCARPGARDAQRTGCDPAGRSNVAGSGQRRRTRVQAERRPEHGKFRRRHNFEIIRRGAKELRRTMTV
jgi:CheY-like chemotaxis protein